MGVLDVVGGVEGGGVGVEEVKVEDGVGGLSMVVEVGITWGIAVMLMLVDVVEGV